MRILYLTQWFEPEPIGKGASFVRALMALGHEIEVVTGFPNYPVGKLYPGYRVRPHLRETIAGVEIHRVALYPSHDRSSLRRTLTYFSFAISAALYGLFRARPFDVIYAYPPPTVGLAAALIGAVRRRPFIQDIQDLWPDSVTTSGMAGTGRMRSLLNLLCNLVYRRAARIVAQSRGIAQKLIERGVSPTKIDVIFNWADEPTARPLGLCDLSHYPFQGKFNIIYGGNFGRVQNLDALIRAAHLARQRSPDLQLMLFGGGVETEALHTLVEQLGATNIRIEKGVPKDQIGDIFNAADVLVLHLMKDPLFEITIPQKTQFYMAMGKPVLVCVNGEARDLVEHAGAGIAAEPGNVEAIAAAMVQLARMPRAELEAMGNRGRAVYREGFSLERAAIATANSLLCAMAGSSRRRSVSAGQ